MFEKNKQKQLNIQLNTKRNSPKTNAKHISKISQPLLKSFLAAVGTDELNKVKGIE